MAYTGKKRKSIIFRILFLAFTVYIIISFTSLQVELIGKRREESSKNAYYNEINLKIEEAKYLLESGNETELIEKAARERLGYYYPDEEVYIDISGQ